MYRKDLDTEKKQRKGYTKEAERCIQKTSKEMNTKRK